MSADKLRGRMYNNICTVLNGADQIRCAECIVDDQRYFMAVGDISTFFNVNNIGIGIAQRLDENGFCILLDSLFKVR